MNNQITLTELVENKISFSEFYSSGDEEELTAYKQALKKKAVDRAVASLTLKEKTTLILHDLEHWSQKEIAQLLEVDKSTVSRNLKRARRKFAAKLALLF